jgi:putative ABC transport system substrate-binding protein
VRRRDFLALLGSATVAYPLPLSAQQPAKVPRIGFLRFGSASANAGRVEALRAGLRELGYVEGKTIIIEFVWAETADQLQEGAAALVRMNVDVIFAMSSTETNAARQATKTIPIIFGAHADPVGVGHVASLPRPGGNITGLTGVQTDLTAKALEIFKEALPQATRFGVLYDPAAPSHRPTLQAAEAAGTKLGVALHMVAVRTVEDFEGAFATMARERMGGFFVHASSLTFSQRTLLAELGLKHRLPGMFGNRDNVEAGGLMSYAPDMNDLTRRAATYIDKILKGVKPADLPVEQASKYQLIINLKTAKAIGLIIPEAFLLRADEVIE